ncbi:MAG TPA: hypothetical protein VMR70_11805 [Flavisolibacter sp.]|nr:hypothetical protein [Flavisolibacter sp.]
MKKMMLVLSFFVSMSVWAQPEEEEGAEEQVSAKQQKSFQDLVGSWRNKSGAGLDIVDSNTVYIVRGDKRIQALVSLSDLKKVPVTFNLTLKDSLKITTLKGLLMPIGENMLQWQVFDSETRPASYSYHSRGDMLFLKRIDRMEN